MIRQRHIDWARDWRNWAGLLTGLVAVWCIGSALFLIGLGPLIELIAAAGVFAGILMLCFPAGVDYPSKYRDP